MKNKFLAIALLSALAAPAFADDTGYFVGLDYIQENIANLDQGFSQPTGGFAIDAGYNFSKNWGVEIGYLASGNSAGANSTITPTTDYLAAVGTYPINESFDAFAKFGIAVNQITGFSGCLICSGQTNLMYGVGADYNINKNVGFRLQWNELGNMMGTSTSGNQWAASYTALGVIYKF